MTTEQPENESTISVLLPVHRGVDPAHFREAVEALLAQTRLPDEIVAVHDGPLDHQHLATLDSLAERHPRVVQIKLPRNGGAGIANQAGLKVASGDWIAKFDADDVCVPARLQRQFDAVMESRVDVCGTAMLEFEGESRRIVALRSGPLTHAAIARRMRFNSPINHPTSMFRRQFAVEVGGYSEMRLMQDYDLFARMLAGGARMMNLPDPLVLFRSGEDMRRRRSGLMIMRLELRLQLQLHEYGIVGWVGMCRNLIARSAFRFFPDPVLRLIYSHWLSRPIQQRAVEKAGA